MIDSIFNLLFLCGHRRLTRPITPVSAKRVPEGQSYIVCLDCGKHVAYDTGQMRLGKVIRVKGEPKRGECTILTDSEI
jgi:DNA-directed RNA polymerase subunit RPC12/RpoP